MKYVALLRGINVGGKNKVSMTDLRVCLEELGYTDVTTYIASGNVLLTSAKSPLEIQAQIEKALPRQFKLDSKLIKVLILNPTQLQKVIDEKPLAFGDQPGTFHSDVIFLMGIDNTEARRVFSPREGVDTVWPGPGVIYSQRLSAERTKSRLGKIVGTPAYKSMTIRTWGTVNKLLEMLQSNP
ncbi:MAG TPA: DUF1697 domain-containing protein [Candidatus Microsaccharimonas sp.]|nr:DUF1697 domain-containing protein [Candidatus Microsaccharimonas sp.]